MNTANDDFVKMEQFYSIPWNQSILLKSAQVPLFENTPKLPRCTCPRGDWEIFGNSHFFKMRKMTKGFLGLGTLQQKTWKNCHHQPTLQFDIYEVYQCRRCNGKSIIWDKTVAECQVCKGDYSIRFGSAE